MKLIPIPEARRLAKECGAQRLLIVASDGEQFTFTTYGKTKADCSALAEWADRRAPYVAGEMMDAEND